jgi:hypothetical protein
VRAQRRWLLEDLAQGFGDQAQESPMPSLLHVSASPRGAASESLAIARTFLDALHDERPEVTADAFDTAASPATRLRRACPGEQRSDPLWERWSPGAEALPPAHIASIWDTGAECERRPAQTVQDRRRGPLAREADRSSQWGGVC